MAKTQFELMNFRYLYFSLLIIGINISCNGISQDSLVIEKTMELIEEKDDSMINYPFIRKELNVIESFNSSFGLDNFYKKLSEIEKGDFTKINIVHFGGSHVQAGQLTSAMRYYFSKFNSESRGERGFVFPSRIIKSNGPDYTKAEFTGTWESCKSTVSNHYCDWGMAGQTAKTSSEISSVKMWSFDVDSVIYQITSCRIYRKDIDNNFHIEIVNKESNEIFQNEKFIDVVFENPIDTLEFNIIKKETTKSNFELQGVLFQNSNSQGISYHGLGVNGAGIKSYLKCDLLNQQLNDLKPDLFIIGLGLNDTYVPAGKFNSKEFLNNYESFITNLKNNYPNCTILLMTNNDSYYKRQYNNKNVIEFNEIIRQLARKHDCSVWDLYGIMGGENSIKKWVKADIAKPDLIHFTNKGYFIQADLLFRSLMRDYMAFNH